MLSPRTYACCAVGRLIPGVCCCLCRPGPRGCAHAKNRRKAGVYTAYTRSRETIETHHARELRPLDKIPQSVFSPRVRARPQPSGLCLSSAQTLSSTPEHFILDGASSNDHRGDGHGNGCSSGTTLQICVHQHSSPKHASCHRCPTCGDGLRVVHSTLSQS